MLKPTQEYIATLTDEVIFLQKEMTRRVALGPQNNGQGEKEKSDFLVDYLRGLGLTDIVELKAPDPDVSCGYRPSIIAKIKGKNLKKTVWILSHMDIVPPGDLSLWKSDPYQVEVNGDILTGRGVEDNQHGLTASLLVAHTLQKLSITPDLNLGLIFVADEETGNQLGIHYLLEDRRDLFNPEDLFLIPDHGVPTSDEIEIAEKGLLWIRIIVHGEQTHASTPQKGINSLRAAAAFILKTEELHTKFNKKNELFSPPFSTFVPSRKEENVPNINTLPGRDVFYLDCRILPGYNLSEIKKTVREMANEIEKDYLVKIFLEVVQEEQAAPVTSQDSEIVQRLQTVIADVYNVTAKPTGIGGGTVAAALRKKGFNAAVWSTLLGNAHQSNEKTSIRNIIKDAQVMAGLVFES